MENNNIPIDGVPPVVPVTPAVPVVEPTYLFKDDRLPQVSEHIQNSAALRKALPSEKLSLDSNSAMGMLTDTRMKTRRFDVGNEAFGELSDGSLIPRFEKYMPGINNEELLARGQSKGDKWWNGIQKLGAKTGTAVLGGTVGMVDGMYQLMSTGSMSAVYDSKFNHFLDDVNTTLDYKLPNYYTEQEKNMNFGQKMTTANFWANDFTGGLSFMLGTIISEGLWAAATGGTSLIAKGMGGLTRAMTKGMGKEAFSALKFMKEPVKRLVRGAAVNQAKNLTKAGIKAGRVMEGLNTTRFLITSAGYEAGVEARGFMTESLIEWKHQFENETGRKPNGEELAKFKEGLTTSANWLFVGNTALVGASNYAVLGKLLMNPAPTRAISNSVFKKMFLGMGYKKTGPGVLKALQANKFQKAFGKAYGVGKSMIMEGVLEEGGQAAMSKGATDYMLNAYSKKANKENISVIESLAKGMEYAYTTKEGLTEVGLGALIGLFGGGISTRGKFNELSQERENIEETVKVVNAFTQENLMTQFKSAAKVKLAEQVGQEAREEGNLTKANTADITAMLAVIERSHHYQSTDELLKDFNTAMEVMDTAEISKELGITEEEVKEWKESRAADFNKLTEEHSRNLEFAEIYIGDTPIAGLDAIPGLKNGNVADLKAAVAYTLTMGTQTDTFTEDLALQIKAMVSTTFDSGAAVDAITVQEVLRKVSTEKALLYTNKSKALARAEERLRAVEQEIVNTELLEDKEDNTTKANKLIRLRKTSIRLQAEQVAARQAKDVALDALNIPLHTDEIITEEMLDNQAENVKKLGATVNETVVMNPQNSAILQNLIVEYGRSATTYKAFNGLVRSLVNQDTRVNLLNGWAAKLINGKKKLGDSEAALFTSMVNDYQSSIGRSILDREGAEAMKSTVQVTEDTTEGTTTDTTVDPLKEDAEDITETTFEEPPIETGIYANVIAELKAQINAIVNKEAYGKVRYGGKLNVALEDVKPTQEEVDEYNTLLGKITEGKNVNIIIKRGYNSKNKTGLTKEETERFQALNERLNNWKIISGLNINQSSISEILEVISQLENVTGINGTKPETVPTDLFKIRTSEEKEGGQTSARLNTIVTPDVAVAKKVKTNNTYEISFLSPISLLRLFPGSTLTAIINDKPVDLATMPEAKLDELTKTPGTKFVLEIEGNKVAIEISDRQRLIVDSTELDALIPNSNIKILDFGNSNYMPLFSKDSEGTFTPLQGDFVLKSIDDNEVITLEGEQLYSLEPGTILDTSVNLNDSFNAQLLAKYKAGKISKEELINNINIYITKQGAVNNILGTLRAIKPSTNTDSDSFAKIYMLRKQAVNKVLKTPGTRVKVGITVTLAGVRIGNPNLAVVEGEDGKLVPTNIKINDESIELIDDFGYMLDGELFTNKNLQYSAKEVTFAKEISTRSGNEALKVPVVVFKYQGRTVVFPVSLAQSKSTKADRVTSILGDVSISDAAKLYAINEFLIDNNINPNKYKIANLESPASVKEVNRLLEDLTGIKEYAKVEDWLESGFKKSELLNTVEIAVDITDKPFNSGTGSLNLKEMGVPTEEDLLVESEEALDSYSKRLSSIFRKTEPFKNMPTTEWDFYLKFEDRDVKLDADTHINKLSNAHILMRAFETKIPKQIRELLGADLIKSIQFEIKQYKILKDGVKINTKAIEGELKSEISNIENECK